MKIKRTFDRPCRLDLPFIVAGDVCYENGSPVVFQLNKPFIIQVGKRKWVRVTIIK